MNQAIRLCVFKATNNLLNFEPHRLSILKTKQQKEKLQRTGVLIVALLAAAGLGALLSNQFGEQQVDPKSEPQSVSDKGPSGESNDSRADIISGSSDGDEKSKEKPRDLETKKLLEDRHTEVRLGLSWDAEPNILRVYQSTEVRLRVKEKPAGHLSLIHI